MEGSRWEELVKRAAASGCLDYRQADSFDPVWLRREELMIAQIEEQAFIDLIRMKHMQQAMAAAGWPDWDDGGKVNELHTDQANKRYSQVGEMLLPYLTWDEVGRGIEQVEAQRQAYIDTFGDPDDPKVREEIERLEEHLRQRRVEARAQKRVEEQGSQIRRPRANMTWKQRQRERKRK